MQGGVLVLGANGQVGAALRRRADGWGRAVAFADRARVDITRPDQIAAALDQVKPAVVVNLAAYTDVDGAESDRDAARSVNRDGARNVAAACRLADAALLQLSTDFVFDGRLGRPYREDDAVSPSGVYGATKAEGEGAVRAALERHLIVRTAWVFGPDQPNFVSAILRRASEDARLRVVDDQVGGPTHTREIARMIVAILDRVDGERGPWGTYHFAGAPAVSRHAFARSIVEAAAPLIGHPVEIEAISSADFAAPAARPADGRLDGAKLRADFGIEAPQWQSGFAADIAAIFRRSLPNK